MKQSQSNPLQQELASLPLVGQHPDFDILAAFAEGALLPREREEVLAHLATCADCRALLSAAAEATAEKAQPVAEPTPYLMPRPSRPPLNTWLPWVSIAAAVLIAASAVIFFRNKDQFSERATVVDEKSQPASSATVQSPQAGTAISTSEPPAAVLQDASPAATRPHWRINSAGQPERSVSDGAWQAALPNEKSKMHVISVFDSDVWIGGENTTLYHSTDNGLIWKQVSLPAKNGSQHTLAQIHFQSAQSGKIESTDSTTWTTEDAGVTWQ